MERNEMTLTNIYGQSEEEDEGTEEENRQNTSKRWILLGQRLLACLVRAGMGTEKRPETGPTRPPYMCMHNSIVAERRWGSAWPALSCLCVNVSVCLRAYTDMSDELHTEASSRYPKKQINDANCFELTIIIIRHTHACTHTHTYMDEDVDDEPQWCYAPDTQHRHPAAPQRYRIPVDPWRAKAS